MASEAQRKLVDFPERKAFRPVLQARPEQYPESDRRKLEHVQRATEAEIERFRHYGSTSDVVVNFKRDLTSSTAKEVHRELDDLHLPTIRQCKDEFLKLARDLGVER